MKYVVSLTTIPSRFDTVYLTLDSLLNQFIVPDTIILNIPNVYGLRYTGQSIPQEKIDTLRRSYPTVIINQPDTDFGPGTKLLASLPFLGNSRNTYVLLVDDDQIYKPTLISHFDNYVSTHDVDAASYRVDIRNNIHIAAAYTGFFIRESTLSQFSKYYDVFRELDFVNYHDDYYISFYFRLLKMRIHFIDNNPSVPLDSSRVEALHMQCGRYSRGNLDLRLNHMLLDLEKKNMFQWMTTS